MVMERIIILKGKYMKVNGKDNKREGKGTLIWPSGIKHIGEFKNDVRSGHGIVFHPDGRKEEGMWHENKFMDVDESKKN